MSKVTIVDKICGGFKTSWAIQYMNDNVESKFIYLTPYLDEVDRVVNSCNDRSFESPDAKRGKGSKLSDFNNLLREGKNIVSTHALFKYVDEETLTNLLMHDYTLILDEVFDVIESIAITKSDKELLLLDGKINIDERGKVTWLDMEYDGRLNEYRKQIENGDVYMMDDTFLFWTFPTKILDYLKHTYILTYLFNGQMQRYYYDMNGIDYEYRSVKRGQDKLELCEYTNSEDMSHLKVLINICDNDKLNSIGKPRDKRSHPLSKGWYDTQTKKKLDGLDVLKRNMENYFRKICKSKSDENMWTTFKDYKCKCKGKGYSKGFVSSNARATNEFRNKTNLAYCVNVFNNPLIMRFFKQKGVEVDEDTYALSELIQWMFRSAIRENKPINIYIPSERMRTLLQKWLGYENND